MDTWSIFPLSHVLFCIANDLAYLVVQYNHLLPIYFGGRLAWSLITSLHFLTKFIYNLWILLTNLSSYYF